MPHGRRINAHMTPYQRQLRREASQMQQGPLTRSERRALEMMGLNPARFTPPIAREMLARRSARKRG